MTFAETLAQDRRLVILQALDQSAGYALNEGVLRTALDHVGHRVSRDIIRGDLAWLEEHRMLGVEKLQSAMGELWLATLQEPGQAVAQGRLYPGIARPSAK